MDRPTAARGRFPYPHRKCSDWLEPADFTPPANPWVWCNQCQVRKNVGKGLVCGAFICPLRESLAA